jgi:hypothetical protein
MCALLQFHLFTVSVSVLANDFQPSNNTFGDLWQGEYSFHYIILLLYYLFICLFIYYLLSIILIPIPVLFHLSSSCLLRFLGPLRGLTSVSQTSVLDAINAAIFPKAN